MKVGGYSVAMDLVVQQKMILSSEQALCLKNIGLT